MEILLVEDDVYCIDFFKRAFGKRGSSVVVHHAGSAMEARAFLETRANVRDICLVVLDIQLPQVSGFELLRYLKENAATRSIPVVMFTSSTDRGDIDLSYQLGANSYLVKPIDFVDFSTTIYQLEEYWLNANQF